jgi:NAD(P)-dependent dehydrogenase (short-subunit alcohol dehydrogenase family)
VIGVDLHDVDVVADLGTVAGRDGAVAAIADACDGRLDGLVTCAGLLGKAGRPGSALVSVNYYGTVALLEGLRPQLAAAGGSSAVAIASNATTVQPGVPLTLTDACLAGDEDAARALGDEVGSRNTYAATKIAVARWVRRHATTPEWIGAGIRLNAIAPGMIDTAMIAEGRADPEMSKMLDLFPIPIGRPGRADEMAALIAFLLGPESSFFCGSLVFSDGGSDALLRTDDWPVPN